MANNKKLISLFAQGYRNKEGKPVLQNRPSMEVDIQYLYDYIIGMEAKEATLAIRREEDEDKQRELKMLTLRTCTPFGTFSYRNAKGLKEPSGLMVVDIDHIDDHDELIRLRERLKNDEKYLTALLYISPRGKGLKWFIEVGDMGGLSLREFFTQVARHVAFTYGVNIDSSGKDVPRTCFLSHDPECYINPKYIH